MSQEKRIPLTWIRVCYRVNQTVEYWMLFVRSRHPRGAAARRVLEMHPTAEIIRFEM